MHSGLRTGDGRPGHDPGPRVGSVSADPCRCETPQSRTLLVPPEESTRTQPEPSTGAPSGRPRRRTSVSRPTQSRTLPAPPVEWSFPSSFPGPLFTRRVSLLRPDPTTRPTPASTSTHVVTPNRPFPPHTHPLSLTRHLQDRTLSPTDVRETRESTGSDGDVVVSGGTGRRWSLGTSHVRGGIEVAVVLKSTTTST